MKQQHPELDVIISNLIHKTKTRDKKILQKQAGFFMLGFGGSFQLSEVLLPVAPVWMSLGVIGLGFLLVLITSIWGNRLFERELGEEVKGLTEAYQLEIIKILQTNFGTIENISLEKESDYSLVTVRYTVDGKGKITRFTHNPAPQD